MSEHIKYANDVKLVIENKEAAFTSVVESGAGYTVGLAEKHISGYTPTGLYFPNYDIATKSAKEMNDLVWPGRTIKATAQIVFSSMFKKQNKCQQ